MIRAGSVLTEQTSSTVAPGRRCGRMAAMAALNCGTGMARMTRSQAPAVAASLKLTPRTAVRRADSALLSAAQAGS